MLRTLPPSCAVVMKSGKLNFLEPSGPLQVCNGTALPFTLRLKADVCDEKSCINSLKHGTALHSTKNKCHKIFKALLVIHNFSAGLKCIHVALRPGPEMLFTHSPILPLFSERAVRYVTTRLREKHTKFLKMSASDERQHQCFMQDGKHFFVYSQFNDSVNTSESNVRIKTG
jgi:hypothetical protein